MSAPDTNIEKQKRRHKGVLIGIAGAVIFAGVMFFLNITSAVVEDDGLVIDQIADDDAVSTDVPPTEVAPQPPATE